MARNPWIKPGKPFRVPTESPLRVILLSLFLAVLLQIPLSTFNSYANRITILSSQSRRSSSNKLVLQHTLQPTSIPHYAFVKYSTYRVSLNAFFVVGISSKVPLDRDGRRVVHTCEWHSTEDDSVVVATNASMLYVEFDENGMTYVPAIVNCTFGEDVGVDGRGGTLVIRVSLTYHRYEKNAPAVVFEECQGEDLKAFTNPPQQKPHKYAFCGPPMHTHLNVEWIKAWMVYHNYIWNGDALFFFYNVGGLKDGDRHLLQEFLDAGRLIITDHSGEDYEEVYPSWYYHQLLFIEDCLFRARNLADHVFFFDFDEFLQITPPETIDTLLHKHSDRPWLTVGSIPADYKHCAPAAPRHRYPIERMLWHNKLPECSYVRASDPDPWLCLAFHGRRKWVANTRYTLLGGVHKAAVPLEGGVDVNASQARVIHFHGVLGRVEDACGVVVPELEAVGNLERDEGIARVFAAAKAFRVRRNANRVSENAK